MKSATDIYTVDPYTGMATYVISTSPSLRNALAFDPFDVAYSLEWNTGDLYTLNVTTGAAVFMGSTGNSTMAALAFAPTTPLNATPLPAALPLFASGLGALGLLGWRRKRKNAAAMAAA